jgi:hypothetical protein
VSMGGQGGPDAVCVGWVRRHLEGKTFIFWQKRSPNCNSMGLPPYPLSQLIDGWVRREG